MSRILIVDDHPSHPVFLRDIFGTVDICKSYADLVLAVRSGTQWSAAFVDFDLSGVAEEAQPTGLSALRLLLQERPRTRRIAYTTLSENGRTLFAVAAYRWLDTTVILDKSSAPETVKAAVATGRDAMPAGWRAELQSAHLVDMLFAKYNWLPLWEIWPLYDGSIRVVQKHLPPGNAVTSVREFSEGAGPAAENFRAAFEGVTRAERSGRPARATPLVAFADTNSKFFHAPDLQDILNFAKPWDRARLAAR
jgi:CheY-like chemotaxis protein